jgi:peptidoglycan/LPS O-acetylase OafA/YrhL
MTKIPELDGLRGLAILLVLLFHGGPIWFGWAGVDLFFVLSGFLITGILLRSRNRSGYFARFYKRRVLRIFPLYFAVLVFTFFVLPRLSAHTHFSGDSGTRWAYFLFVQNLVLVNLGGGPLFVTWSLAIEEQFYLVWPWLVRWLTTRTLTVAMIVLFLTLPLIRALVGEHSREGLDYHLYTLCRLDGLSLGALLALAAQADGPLRQRIAGLALPVGVVGLVGSIVTLSVRARWAGCLEYSFLALLFAGMLSLALQPQHRTYRAILRHPFLVYAGTISYGLYLLHPFANSAVQSALDHAHWHVDVRGGIAYAIFRAAQLGLSLLLATVSWYGFESPISRLKASWAQ